MIEEDAFAENRCRVDVGLVYVGGPALQIEREVGAALGPEPMREPVRLYRVKPLEIQKWFDQPFACRVAVEHRHDVRRRLFPHLCRPGKNIGDKIGRNNLIAEPRRDPVNDRVLERRTV